MGSGRAAARLTVARSLQIDGYTGEVVRSLRARGIRPVLLKGPALANWLYDDPAERPYVDCDLLVPPGDLPTAESVLAELGFEVEPADPTLRMHASPWVRRSDGAQVDLHRSLAAVSVGPADAWRAIAGLTQTEKVGGREVDVLRPAARALIVALHVAHHGTAAEQAMEDLRRALARVPDETWIDASAIAERLNAAARFATALRALPEGARLAERIGLASPELLEAAIRPSSRAPVALAFERLSRQRGLRAKLGMIWSELFPTPDFIRWWWPPAARGRAALAVGYAWRIVWIFWHAWPSARLWRQARNRQPR